ncbi:uncharacterized protein LOC114357426 [Ostrinia furnacalis]|uniref:uncharacterized protein LOC114357426 n=1 Tax=Ostrinia furnacalis TaxID=93504 RepID=UPI00103D1118|nr:uncharacterized protein LOC114357426 [Ostrinia furnacalis]
MNTLATFTALLLVGLASTKPTTNDDTLHIVEDLFPEEFVIYTGEKDITKIVVPLNSINFDDKEDVEETSDDENIYVFFIEEGKGLSVLKNKQATKLLENGNDISASSDQSKEVYFAASDGIYRFNEQEKKAEKYGTVTDNTIAIAVINGTNDFYILTAENVVYKVTDDGTRKEEITNVKDAQQILLDSANNLYFVDNKKHVYVRLAEDGTVKSIKGLPAHPSDVQLLRPPFVVEEAVPVVAGKKTYLAYANGTSEFADIILDTKPSAISFETTLLIFAGHNNKIYEYNLLAIVLTEMAKEELSDDMKEVKSFFSDQTSNIQSIATRSRSSFRA